MRQKFRLQKTKNGSKQFISRVVNTIYGPLGYALNRLGVTWLSLQIEIITPDGHLGRNSLIFTAEHFVVINQSVRLSEAHAIDESIAIQGDVINPDSAKIKYLQSEFPPT